MDVFTGFINSALAAGSDLLVGLTYVFYVVVKWLISFTDFDPFLPLIDQYGPDAVIGSDFAKFWAFANGWIPIRDCLALTLVFFEIWGLCILFRALYNWGRFGTTKGGGE